MYLYELEIGTPVRIECTNMIHTISFDTVVKGKRGSEVIVNAIRREQLLVNFDSDKVRKSVIVSVEGKDVIFSKVTVYKVTENKEAAHVLCCESEGIATNRRSAQRFIMNVPCMFTLSKDSHVKHATLHDIGLTGFSFLSRDTIDLGEMIEASFNDTATSNLASILYFKGEIVRVDESTISGLYSYGVKIDKESKQLQDFVMKLQRRRLAMSAKRRE